MSVTIKLRKGTAAEWLANNSTVLASGEPGFELDTGRMKIGNGTSTWANLNYASVVPTGLLAGSGIGINLGSNGSTATISVSGSFVANSGTFNQVVFNTGLEDPDLLTGQLQWNSTEGTLDLGLEDNYTMHLGEEVLYRIRNSTGTTLLAGQPVYASGLSPGGNNRIEVNLYTANGTIREVQFMGLITQDLPNGGTNGYATQFGYIRGIDTRGDATTYGTTNKLWAAGEPSWNEGDILYVHPTIAGKLTKIEPKHSISVAIITNKASNGKIFVRPTSYGHLDDNHDVNVSGVTNGQYLQYNEETDYWVPTNSGLFSQLNVSGVVIENDGFGSKIPGTITANYLTLEAHVTTAPSDEAGKITFTNGSSSSFALTVPTYTVGLSSGPFTITLPESDGIISLEGHTHTSSDITNFNSSVSGLLPTIANSGDNRILTSTGSTVGINAESNATFDGTNFNVTGVMNVDNLRLDGNTLSATNTNGSLIVQSNGTGAIQRDSGGNARGQYAVDWQNVRSTGTMVAAGAHSVIGGGKNNRIADQDSVICGGSSNTISGISYSSSIVGGERNTISNNSDFIGGGTDNLITQIYGSIVGGRTNTVSGSFGFVGGGANNKAQGLGSVVCGGGYDLLGGGNTAAGIRTVIGGGFNNIASGNYSAILGGENNNDGNYSNVFILGSNITATQANTTFVNNLDVASSGDIDTLKINKLYHQNLAVATGIADSDLMIAIVDPTGSPTTEVIQGSVLRSSLLNQPAQLQFRQGTNAERLLITPASGEPIWTTDTQKFYIGDGSTVGGDFIGPSPYGRDSGDGSIVALNLGCTAIGATSVVCGGFNNASSGASSAIGGGLQNTASGSASTIGGGRNNVSSNSNSTVAGGRQNTASAIYSTVGGGYGNLATGNFSTIAGGGTYPFLGDVNTASGGYSFIGGGKGNSTSGSNSVICGGYQNQATATSSTVVGGEFSKSTRHGELSHAAGRFASRGDAQHTVLIARRLTTNNTANQVLFLNGSSLRLTLPAETTWTFEVKLSAYNDTDNAAAGWIYRGVIRRNAANGTVLVGSLIEESWKETAMNSTSASVVADDTNAALEIRVTGLTGKNIRWVAVVDISQVSYGTP